MSATAAPPRPSPGPSRAYQFPPFERLTMDNGLSIVIARLTTYIGTAAAVPILRRRFGSRPNAVRLPGGATIPVLALLLSLAFLTSASWKNLVAGAIALVVGALIYSMRRRDQATGS